MTVSVCVTPVKLCTTALRNAKKFGCKRSRHRPALAHRLFVETADGLMGRDK
jgi:hypothetical protein